MQLEEKQVMLRKLIASEGKIIISKEVDEEGNPLVKAYEIYLGNNDSEDNYIEIDDVK